MRGADLPLYFCESACAIQLPNSVLNASSLRCASVRLVVAEERENHIRLRVGAGEAILRIPANGCRLAAQPLVRRSEVLRSQARRDLIAAETKIADHQLVSREPRLQQRLQPSVVLQPLGQGVADDADVIFRLKHERRDGGSADGRRPRNGCPKSKRGPPSRRSGHVNSPTLTFHM